MSFKNKVLLWGMKKLNRLYLNQLKADKTPNPNNYEDLSPIDSADKDGNYSEALEFALKNPKIKNVAISGSFGSGKSSFLRTFEKNHPEWNYLNISLATFKESKNNLEENISTVDSKLIEKSILQQIFYKVEKQQIPRSSFKRIQNISNKKIFTQAFILTLWLLSALTIFKPEIIKKVLYFNDLKILETIGYLNYKELYSLIILSVFLLLSGYLVFIINKHFTNLQISKLNLLKGEAEINKKDDKGSMLNENIDEILYFFEATNYNVVVIEDLDRFKNIDVFIKLREINELINNSDQIEGQVIFIYAIKDDMFNDDSRSKFFEFMIPIIPYINQSNSYEKLLQKFGKSVSKEFLNDIAIYIDDMRLLNNISNEFKIYESKIENIKNKTKLLAMIIYKNLYPSDFSALHKNEGILANIIKSKNKYLQSAIKGINDEIVSINNEIQEISSKKEWMTDLLELRTLYAYELTKKYGTHFHIDDERVLISEITTSDEEFKKLVTSTNIYDQSRYGSSKTTFLEFDKALSFKLSYEQRKDIITGKTNKLLQNLQEKIENLHKKKTSISRYSLKKLLKIEATSKRFSTDIGDKKILKYLIQYGYINEDFYIYISHFFPGSITVQDHEFWISVKDQKTIGFEHKLNEISGLLPKLREKEFEHHSILNYDLVDFLLENLKLNHQQTNTLFTQLSDKSETSLGFIRSYFDITKHKGEFVKMLAKHWNGFWVYIDKDSGFSDSQKNMYLLSILQFTDMEDINKLNEDLLLQKYISEKKDFIKIVSAIDNKIIQELLSSLNIKFTCLSGFKSNPEVSQYIYENNHYLLNEKMINKIIKYKTSLSKDNKAKLKTSHFTTIKELGLSELSEYISSDINTYVENSLLAIENNTEESEGTTIELINNPDLEIRLKIEIMRKEHLKIIDITTIQNKALWNSILNRSFMVPSWKNILHHYENSEEKINESLLYFLNDSENYNELTKKKLNDEEKGFPELLDQHLSEEILLTEEINDQAYEKLVQGIRFWFPNLPISDLSPLKVNALLENNKLQFTQENINNLSEYGDNEITTFLENNITLLIDELESYEIPIKSYSFLINSSTINTEDKIKVINKIIELGLSHDDEFLNAVYKLVSINPFKIATELLELLLSFNEYTLEDDMSIFIDQIKYLSKDEISYYLGKSGMPYSDIQQTGHKPIYLDKNDRNMKLVNKLEESGYISSHSKKFTRIRINTKHF